MNNISHRFRKYIKSLIVNHPFVVPKRYSGVTEELREAETLASGRSMWDDQARSCRLRILAHALDKALNMKTFERGRGQDLLDEARVLLTEIAPTLFVHDPSLSWCRDKVNEYSSAAISGARHTVAQSDDTAKTVKSSFTNLMGIIMERRSCRSFQNRPVPRDVVENLVDAARWAPSSCDRQPVGIYLAIDPILAADCHSTCRGKRCFGEYIPAFAAICVDLRPYIQPEEFHLPHVDGALAAQNFCLAAQSLGLGSTLMAVGMESNEDRRRLRGLLKIPDNMRIIVNCTFGYPDVRPPIPVRRPVDFMFTITPRE